VDRGSRPAERSQRRDDEWRTRRQRSGSLDYDWQAGS